MFHRCGSPTFITNLVYLIIDQDNAWKGGKRGGLLFLENSR